LGLIRALEEQGLEPREIGFQVYGFMQAYIQRRPKWLMRLGGRLFLWKPTIWAVKRHCRQTQQRRYPGDWVDEFVPPSPGDYALGMDVKECGVCKFYEAQGALPYAHYICLGDYPMFYALGLGLRRTTTLANGGPCCDFRITKGKTPPGWSPENLAEFRSV
jgi:hypothetical protein